jgi:hypothetical protein
LTDISRALTDIIDLCRTLIHYGSVTRTHLRQLEDLHQRLTYAVIYGNRAPTPAVERSSKHDRQRQVRMSLSPDDAPSKDAKAAPGCGTSPPAN